MPVLDDAATATFLFAWCDEDTPWSEDLARCDEDVYAWELEHEENDAAELRIDIDNPKVGLLGEDRSRWCWFTWRNGDTLVPLFHGELQGQPEDMAGEQVHLIFHAKASDYLAQKADLAASLREKPWYDELWLQEGGDITDDAVLETRTAAWHIDPTTLELSISDLGQGEDGTLVFTADDHYYDGLRVEPQETPASSIAVTGSVEWDQVGSGDVDLTELIWQAFRDSGSPFQFPVIGTFTSDGLLNDWPAAGAAIGGGWSVGNGAIAQTITWQKPAQKTVRYVEKPAVVPTAYQLTSDTGKIGDLPIPTILQEWRKTPLTLPKPQALLTPAEEAALGWKNWDVLFEVTPIQQNFPVHYETSRRRTETVTFTVTADVQPLVTETAGTDQLTISLASKVVNEPIDPGGVMPIGSLAKNSFFPTDRGQLALQYLMLLARAHLYERARAVKVTFEPDFELVAGVITCRMNAAVQDSRIPGGEALGKVIAYTIGSDGGGKPNYAQVVIGCMVGHGEVLPEVPEPANDYIDDYVDDLYEREIGGLVPVIAGELRYGSFDGAYVVDDDGLDLFNMVPSTVVQAISITNGVSAQETAINDARKTDPVGGLRAFPTSVSLTLVPLTGQSFQTDYPVTVDTLVLPKTIDLEVLAP